MASGNGGCCPHQWTILLGAFRVIAQSFGKQSPQRFVPSITDAVDTRNVTYLRTKQQGSMSMRYHLVVPDDIDIIESSRFDVRHPSICELR